MIDVAKYEGWKRNYHCICSCYEEEMVPRKEHISKHSFLKFFLFKSHETFAEKVKSKEVTKFIEEELIRKQKVKNLLDKIDSFISNLDNKDLGQMARRIC